jgi:FMN phosphatase YigB (HAD superfamily)
MKPRHYYRLESLLRQADAWAADCRTISFDLFDTLLIRRVHFPDMLKSATARYIALKAKSLGITCSPQQVQALRDETEQAQRRRTAQRFIDHEACYPDFMTETLTRIFGAPLPAGTLEEVSTYELSIESAMLLPRERLLTWMRGQRALGKRILVLSDIYLPAAMLRTLIANAGFIDAVDLVASSADTFLAKASGKGYEHLIAQHGLDVGSWLHIGDNPISDGLQPARFGIRALVLHDAGEKQRKLVVRGYTACASRRPFWKGRLLQQLMLPLEAENQPRHPLYVEGYNFLGPLVGAFVQGIAERCRRLDIERLYFLSREGWIFQQCWRRIVPLLYPDGQLPAENYLLASRRALAGCTCARQGLTCENADIGLLSPANRDLRDLCRLFGLDENELRPHFQRHGLEPDTAVSWLYASDFAAVRERFYRLLADAEFQAEVKRQTHSCSQALERYLERIGFFRARDVALVDVGWLGTIPRFIFEAIKHRPDRPRLHVFLMGASRGIPYPTRPDHYVDGVLFDADRGDLCGSVMNYNLDLFEEAFRAPHAGLIGYRLQEETAGFVFRDDTSAGAREEAAQSRHYRMLQAGILDAASRYGAAAAVLGFESGEYKPWLNYLLVSKLAFPKAGEVALLRQKHHFDDFGAQRVIPRKIHRLQRHLWHQPPAALRWLPGLRTRYFLRQALNLLRR